MPYAALERFLDEQKVFYKKDEPMAIHTTFKIGGKADLYIEPSTAEALRLTVEALRKEGIPFFTVGKGSNLLVSDRGIGGAVVSTARLDEIKLIDDAHIYAGAGASLTAVCLFALKHSLSGLEFAYGIPGSIGGAVYMNAGAYGGEIAQVTESVESLGSGLEAIRRSTDELGFSYRNSVFCGSQEIITGAVFRLTKGDAESIQARMNELMGKRKASQPLDFPSAGSTFKRPHGFFAAALIDECGLKGASVGGAQVSEKHAGFIINKDRATCDDVLALIERVRQTVLEQKGVTLQTEVIYCGR